jgi:uncharacterized coiled-coil protein SlyX
MTPWIPSFRGRSIPCANTSTSVWTKATSAWTTSTNASIRSDRRLDQVDRRFDQVDQRFDQVDRRFDSLDERAAGWDQRLDHLEEALTDLRQHGDATAVQTRRHFDVVVEGLRGDIRLIAEGFTRIDRVEITLRDEIVRSHDTLAALIRLTYTDLDRRVQVLERRSGDSD